MKQNELLNKAVNFAIQEHTDTFRKYTQEPYVVHPIEVADLVYNFCMNNGFESAAINLTIGALLHDTVEDCETTYTDIESMFGIEVRDIVFWLTDVTTKAQANRRVRKELELVRLLAAPGLVKIIKLCDLMSNTKSIVEHDVNFAATYLSEKAAILAAYRTQTVAKPSDPLSVPLRLLLIAELQLNKSRNAISKP